ncbi:hypothetical protein MTR67_010598 [Solanum verrucosum]|uniref:Uncharacterized protein n=1 Tax=Solanum verrucosum TaxID=315347 RepID=A0AAF0TIH4_SOLVR|nr:hypothetical protein MTR67_010598 [Solanum verrucosum]
MISDCWTVQGWNLNFRRLLNDWEIERVAKLLEEVGDFADTNTANDVVRWSHSKDGIFAEHCATTTEKQSREEEEEKKRRRTEKTEEEERNRRRRRRKQELKKKKEKKNLCTEQQSQRSCPLEGQRVATREEEEKKSVGRNRKKRSPGSIDLKNVVEVALPP